MADSHRNRRLPPPPDINGMKMRTVLGDLPCLESNLQAHDRQESSNASNSLGICCVKNDEKLPMIAGAVGKTGQLLLLSSDQNISVSNNKKQTPDVKDVVRSTSRLFTAADDKAVRINTAVTIKSDSARRTSGLFTTAGDKAVTINTAALKKTESLFTSLRDQYNAEGDNSSKKSASDMIVVGESHLQLKMDRDYHHTQIADVSIYPSKQSVTSLFKTAGKRTFTLSDAALKRTESLFADPVPSCSDSVSRYGGSKSCDASLICGMQCAVVPLKAADVIGQCPCKDPTHQTSGFVQDCAIRANADVAVGTGTSSLSVSELEMNETRPVIRVKVHDRGAAFSKRHSTSSNCPPLYERHQPVEQNTDQTSSGENSVGNVPHEEIDPCKCDEEVRVSPLPKQSDTSEQKQSCHNTNDDSGMSLHGRPSLPLRTALSEPNLVASYSTSASLETVAIDSQRIILQSQEDSLTREQLTFGEQTHHLFLDRHSLLNVAPVFLDIRLKELAVAAIEERNISLLLMNSKVDGENARLSKLQEKSPEDRDADRLLVLHSVCSGNSLLLAFSRIDNCEQISVSQKGPSDDGGDEIETHDDAFSSSTISVGSRSDGQGDLSDYVLKRMGNCSATADASTSPSASTNPQLGPFSAPMLKWIIMQIRWVAWTLAALERKFPGTVFFPFHSSFHWL